MAEVLTPQQQAAVFDRGGTLLVSAAAGSGKTSVLVERVISLLKDKNSNVSADELLIVTFTNAAAAEMRLRIEKRLNEEIEKNQYYASVEYRNQLINHYREGERRIREYLDERCFPAGSTTRGDILAILDEMNAEINAEKDAEQ